MLCSSWGDVVEWGSRHKKQSAEDCCRSCQERKKQTADDLDCNGTTFNFVLSRDRRGCAMNIYQGLFFTSGQQKDRPPRCTNSQPNGDHIYSKGDNRLVHVSFPCLPSLEAFITGVAPPAWLSETVDIFGDSVGLVWWQSWLWRQIPGVLAQASGESWEIYIVLSNPRYAACYREMLLLWVHHSTRNVSPGVASMRCLIQKMPPKDSSYLASPVAFTLKMHLRRKE